MMARGIEKLFPTLEELGIGFVAYSPLANGLLSGAYEKATNKNFEAVVGYRSRMPQFMPEAMKKNEELMAFLQKDRGRTQRNHVTALPSLDARQTFLANSYLPAAVNSKESLRTPAAQSSETLGRGNQGD